MINTIDEFVKLCRKSMRYDPWAKKRGLKGYCEEINNEAEELMEAMQNDDIENLREEFGDIFIDLVHAILNAENEGHFTMKDVIDGASRKLNRRKPFLAEGRQVTLDEAKEIWKRVKEEEKNG